MLSIVRYFAGRPIIAHVMMFGLIGVSVVLWEKIGKEEMPEFAMEWIRASVRYPGASAEDVELFITKPIEEKIKGLSGLAEVTTTSAYGSSSISITFEANTPNLSEKVQEVKDAIDSTDFPREAEDPTYRQFKSAEKAIIDIGVFMKHTEILDVSSRQKLQEYALAFKNKLLAQPEISGVDESGYLRPEFQIKVKPDKLVQYELSMSQVKSQILQKNVRRPLGNLQDEDESEVTIISELDTVDSLKKMIITSGFRGNQVKLGEIATIETGFEKTTTISKIQGREAVVLNIKKSTSTDILTAQKAVVKFLENFEIQDPDSPVEYILMDDESYDVRNRLNLIGANGLIGFLLIVIFLFIFLDFKSGIWVAMGIPFSLAFTLLCAMLVGYTINNMTLAAIIVVLGIVVDDAIIVAENIVRRKDSDELESAAKSTMNVLSPIIASILTTCAAFIPLYFFSGRFGLFVKYIPTVIFFMLFASLIESFFILPAHMAHPLPLEKWFSRLSFGKIVHNVRSKWTHRIESLYERFLNIILKLRTVIFILFAVLLYGSFHVFTNDLSYVMFPKEESRDFRVKVTAEEGVNRLEMAKKIRPIEDLFMSSSLVTSVSSRIGQSRRGGQVKENEASITVEILPPSEREVSLNKMMTTWQPELDAMVGFEEIKFQKSRFGSDSGSPIVIEVQENNDSKRKEIVTNLISYLSELKDLTNVEAERPINKNEYRLKIKREEASRLGINYDELSTVLRSYVEGDILYTLNFGEEEIDVRFTSATNHKSSMNELLKLTVANKDGYLVPIRNVVETEKSKKPASIQRVNYKRSTVVYADLAAGTETTPLEIADVVESTIFPRLTSGNPTLGLTFRGEVEDSREAQSDFTLSIILALIIIYVLLVFLFDSIWTPFLIGAIIPFGVVGTVLAFWLHGLSQYGFFAVVGTLGMLGVVINDSIVMIDKLKENKTLFKLPKVELKKEISKVCATRLRAVFVTTVTTVAGLFPTAYGLGGYDSMLAEMMLAMGWGLLFGMFITLILVPCIYSVYCQTQKLMHRGET